MKNRSSRDRFRPGILSPDGTKARAVKKVMKLTANSLSVAKVADDSNKDASL